ncbi:MAG: response regulator transcription factor [Gaiellaceae bacterium]
MRAAEGSRPLVLVADDDKDILQLLRLRLELWGYGVVQAANGVQALELARELEPALVILDVMMPGLDGLHVAQELRAGNSRIPIILLTARIQETDVEAGLEAGADAYLGKPFDAADLRNMVHELLAPAALPG